MNLVPRIEGSKLVIFNADNGSIEATATLPGDYNYSGPIVSGDSVTVSLHSKYGGSDKIRVYNMKRATLVREISL